ncbi:cyclopropane fatty acid synthase [Schizophyllum amplum]|uniref:Cyclopropane fatty acid synthase n=1 Tax=Schizophyllum amplum TaxID=97359 RepID=A0A550CTP3_9AGAR|nr:cyclopropane fatty acid synthase [Auriculariopsis ampla]
MTPSSIETRPGLYSASMLTLQKRRSPFSMSMFSPRASITSFARKSILAVLDDAIATGVLTVTDTEGTRSYGCYEPGCNQVTLVVTNDNFWLRMLLYVHRVLSIFSLLIFNTALRTSDVSLLMRVDACSQLTTPPVSEAYMIGDVQVDNLRNVMKLWIDNQSGMERSLSSTFSRLSSATSALYNGLMGQTRANSRLNVIASYDQSNELFKAFLSTEMMYSCALWGEEEGGVRGDMVSGPTPGDLEAAQRRKIHHVLQKARLQPGHRILEFGTGWGALAIVAAVEYGCEVDTITLSVEQKRLAEGRIREAGVEGKIRVHLLDYREIPAEFEKAFDAFISIEMVEHVGAKHYNTYFKLIDFALKSRDATAVISSSTFPESRYSTYQAEDFMRRYMWPNSCLPSATAIVTAAHSACSGRFTLDSVANHSAHYPRTLREWDRRLDANLTRDLVSKDFPSLTDNEGDYDAFKRKWRYLFAYASAGFARGYITCHMWTFVRGSDIPEPCD